MLTRLATSTSPRTISVALPSLLKTKSSYESVSSLAIGYGHVRTAASSTNAISRARTLARWGDCELLEPSHRWFHMPVDKPGYYEIVLPKVFRAGLGPGENVRIAANQVQVAGGSRRIFEYVIVGDADTHPGLQAP